MRTETSQGKKVHLVTRAELPAVQPSVRYDEMERSPAIAGGLATRSPSLENTSNFRGSGNPRELFGAITWSLERD